MEWLDAFESPNSEATCDLRFDIPRVCDSRRVIFRLNFELFVWVFASGACRPLTKESRRPIYDLDAVLNQAGWGFPDHPQELAFWTTHCSRSHGKYVLALWRWNDETLRVDCEAAFGPLKKMICHGIENACVLELGTHDLGDGTLLPVLRVVNPYKTQVFPFLGALHHSTPLYQSCLRRLITWALRAGRRDRGQGFFDRFINVPVEVRMDLWILAAVEKGLSWDWNGYMFASLPKGRWQRTFDGKAIGLSSCFSPSRSTSISLDARDL